MTGLQLREALRAATDEALSDYTRVRAIMDGIEGYDPDMTENLLILNSAVWQIEPEILYQALQGKEQEYRKTIAEAYSRVQEALTDEELETAQAEFLLECMTGLREMENAPIQLDMSAHLRAE